MILKYFVPKTTCQFIEWKPGAQFRHGVGVKSFNIDTLGPRTALFLGQQKQSRIEGALIEIA